MSSQPTIQYGSKGVSVTFLQQRLNAKGFHVTTDGDFGNETRDAVEQFQASCGIQADGVVGPMTWTLVCSEGQVTTPVDVVFEQKQALLRSIPADVSPVVKSVLTTAIYALGLKEIPDGSNGGPEIAEIVEGEGGDGLAPSAYYLYWHVTDKATLQTMPAWCCLFVSWAMKKGLGKATWKEIPWGNWLGGCSQAEDWAQKHGRWTPAPTGADVWGKVPGGAAFTISREGSGSDAATSSKAGHIGLVICENQDGTLTTIEGNISNKVGSHRRSKKELRGYITWF